jgi:hypothetical protein
LRDATAVRYHLGQDLAPVLQRHVSQVVAVEVQEVEGDENRVCAAGG